MALPPPIQNFIDGPKLPKVVLGLVGVVAIAAVSYFLLLSPVQVRIDALVVKRTQVTAEVNTARAQVAELERFRREIAELEKRLALLKDRLPSEKETPTLYRAVSTAAEQSGLGVSLFQPRAHFEPAISYFRQFLRPAVTCDTQRLPRAPPLNRNSTHP